MLMTSLTNYRALGHSGLIVSPLTLGTMTFGTARWGAPADDARAIFNAYVEAGGNSIDTADIYSGGTSEELVGRFVAEGHRRDELVLATKFGFSAQKGNPNAGGNGRKQIHRALEGSLHRLGTDYIDLYWLHVWDQVTPAEEVLQTLVDLVRAGKIRYFGLSDMPAWYATQLATPGPRPCGARPGSHAARILAGSPHSRNRVRARRPRLRHGHYALEPVGRRFSNRQIRAGFRNLPARQRGRRTPERGQSVFGRQHQIHGA